MAQMIRKQIYIKKKHEALLKRMAKMLGVSEAEVIRQALEQHANPAEIGSLPRDPEAWEKAYRFMLSRLNKEPPTIQPRDWTRDDLYEERMKRYER